MASDVFISKLRNSSVKKVGKDKRLKKSEIILI